jgi:hypothetical protein
VDGRAGECQRQRREHEKTPQGISYWAGTWDHRVTVAMDIRMRNAEK